MKLNLRGLEFVLLILGLYTDVLIEPAVMLLVVILIFLRNGKIVANKKVYICFSILFLWSVATIITLGYSPRKFFQQFVLLFYFFTGYYIIFRNNEDNINTIFRIYIKVTYFLCITAIVQFVVFFLTSINIFFYFNFSGHGVIATVTPKILRVTSVCVEPSNFSRLITPAFGYFLFKGIENRKELTKFLVITLTLLLTFSTMSYIVALIMLAYKYLVLKKSKLFRVASAVVCIASFLVLFNMIISDKNENDDRNVLSDISMKIRDVVVGFQELDPKAFELLNLSTYATMTNVWVAMNADNRVSGTGLGTHEQNYEAKYQSKFKYYGLNKQEGYALGNRIYSEFGVLGLFLLALFLYKCHNKNNIINICVFFVIFTLVFRGGHYTRYGTIFFIFLYYFTSKYIATKQIDKL